MRSTPTSCLPNSKSTPISSNLDNASNIANLYTESNSNVYVKDKDWGTFLISPTSTTYGYTIDTNNVIVPGTTQASSFASLPCLVTVNVPGMNATYTPTISLYMQRANSTSVANIQAQNKAFSCIGRVDTASNALHVIFYKKPAKGLFQKIRSAFSNDKKCIKVLDFNYITRSFDNIIQKISPKNEHSRVSGYLDYLIDKAEKENLLTEKK